MIIVGAIDSLGTDSLDKRQKGTYIICQLLTKGDVHCLSTFGWKIMTKGDESDKRGRDKRGRTLFVTIKEWIKSILSRGTINRVCKEM